MTPLGMIMVKQAWWL